MTLAQYNEYLFSIVDTYDQVLKHLVISSYNVEYAPISPNRPISKKLGLKTIFLISFRST